jgi:GGDEF domain-containing protein
VTFARARLLILVVGLAAIGVTAGVMWARGVDSVEIGSTLLFAPVLVAFLYWNVLGGAIAGAVAGGAYLFMRRHGIEAVGWSEYTGLIVGRWIGYLAFGTIGGLGTSWLGESLTKLERTDYVDDGTGLYNARFLLDETQMRSSEANRYDHPFALLTVDVPRDAFVGSARKARAAAMRSVADFLHGRVRVVDRAVALASAESERFVFVLPATSKAGAQVVADRLREELGRLLSELGAQAISSSAVGAVLGYPEDVDAINTLRADAARLEALPEPELLVARQEGAPR